MKSELVKVAQIEERTAVTRMVLDTLTAVLTHPVVLSVGGFYLSDRLQGEWITKKPYLAEYKGVDTWITEKYWDHDAGKLNGGAAIAMQTGLIAYLGSTAIKDIAGAFK